jgi:hypothetical protein
MAARRRHLCDVWTHAYIVDPGVAISPHCPHCGRLTPPKVRPLTPDEVRAFRSQPGACLVRYSRHTVLNKEATLCGGKLSESL